MNADVVVVGAGIAGLTTALSAADDGLSTIVICKGALGEVAATGWAQGGIAAAIGDDDEPALHARDTIAAAGGIADPHAVEILTGGAQDAIDLLLTIGVQFDRDEDGKLALGREAAHGRRRIVHAGGDATGRAILDALVRAVRTSERITVVENADARSILGDRSGARGVVVQCGAEAAAVSARAVVLATGGVGGLYAATTNPREACGDGLALAMRVGARCADLEFVQFHPTALAVSGADPMPLLTEALRGEGACLVDERGERFMLSVDPAAELAPRDIVARAIFARHSAGSRVFLDATMLRERLPVRFPTVFAHCARGGIDPRRDLIPVAPAAHYHMGGIAVDSFGRSTVPYLWACGEVAATGVHGANRLASNSLLEGVVFSRRIAKDIAGLHVAVQSGAGEVVDAVPARCSLAGAVLRETMYRYAGVIRDEAGLSQGLETLRRLARTRAEDADRVMVAIAILTAALERRESRGSHFRADFPHASSQLARRSFVAA